MGAPGGRDAGRRRCEQMGSGGVRGMLIETRRRKQNERKERIGKAGLGEGNE